MSIPLADPNNPDIASIRRAIGARLGEIIESVIGDSRIKELMEAAPHQESENKDIPTVEIALKMGVITLHTKTALLVAQAAERTLQLADKAKDVMLGDQATSMETGDKKYHDDPIFKFVGSERDPRILQYAQAVWMAAQMLLNNEIDAVNERMNRPDYIAKPWSEGLDAVSGLQVAAKDLYARAGNLLAAEGHEDAAGKLKAVAQTIMQASQNRKPPREVMESLRHQINRGSQALAQTLHDPSQLEVPQPMIDVYNRLARLTNPLFAVEALRPSTAVGGKPTTLES